MKRCLGLLIMGINLYCLHCMATQPPGAVVLEMLGSSRQIVWR